jgi:hypothetical protein
MQFELMQIQQNMSLKMFYFVSASLRGLLAYMLSFKFPTRKICTKVIEPIFSRDRKLTPTCYTHSDTICAVLVIVYNEIQCVVDSVFAVTVGDCGPVRHFGIRAIDFLFVRHVKR